MNKSAIKSFAISARKKLIKDVEHKCALLGITAEGIAQPVVKEIGMEGYAFAGGQINNIYGGDIGNRAALAALVKLNGFSQVVEEVAYTWFNRIIAIRFMEVNDYLPSHTRVLSSCTSGKNEPDAVTDALDVRFDIPGENAAEIDNEIYALKQAGNTEKLFQLQFTRQCRELGKLLPELFTKDADFLSLLLSISYSNPDGVVHQLIHTVSEEDFCVRENEKGEITGQVEIIGWLYQYYNTEPKDEVFALLKKNVKITKERIPAATQLFTPDWIVRYMVENSLGRLWIDHINGMHHKQMPFRYPDDTPEEVAKINSLKSNWRYYLDEAEQEPEVESQLRSMRAELSDLNPEEIKIVDPCMGSGHILVYAFDVLMQIYVNNGFTQRDAASLIIENNLYGLDIDRRACQLAYFALMMKARQYDRRFFSRHKEPHVHVIIESNDLISIEPAGWHFDKVHHATAKYLVDVFRDAKEYGSILRVEDRDYDGLQFYLEKVLENTNDAEQSQDLLFLGWANSDLVILLRLIEQAKLMTQKYHVVCTNPPYMGSSGMSTKLSDYVKAQYPDSKSDLFAVFMERCGQMTAKNCYQAMITQHAWMFLSSFEELRGKLLNKDTVNMAHLGARAFEEIGGEVVQTTSFVLRNSYVKNCKGIYCRLIEPTSQKGKEDMFLAGASRFESAQDNFSKIFGRPFAYWLSDALIKNFEKTPMSQYGDAKQGLISGDNNRFLRLWYEISSSKFRSKWFPYNKGGEFRRWYGNNDYTINWEKNGFEIRNFKDEKGKLRSRPQNLQYFFLENVTWTKITMGSFSTRYIPEGFIFSDAGSSFFPRRGNNLLYILGYTNSKVAQVYLESTNPTINYGVGQICGLPLIINETQKAAINDIVSKCINLSQIDWDSFETSWDFKRHPLIANRMFAGFPENPVQIPIRGIKVSWKQWAAITASHFKQLKQNEEELNRIFIDIYGLQDELTPEVADKDVTVHYICDSKESAPDSLKNSNYLLTKKDVVISLISYAVGCMLGRYSLDVDGLAYAGGEWDDSKYKSFIPDADNCIPITDEEYFEDDIVGRFVAFIRTVYGAETLKENLDFIAAALGNKGNTSREVIRNYFLNDFFKNHCQIYQKRPIYWLFDSGKQNGFKALCYMHRYDKHTVSRVRTEYLHKAQTALEAGISMCNNIIDSATGSADRSRALKRKEKLVKQLEETRLYDQAIAHIANQYINIDLDDGVKVNYAKFQGVEVSKEGKKAQKVNLLGEV